MTTEQICFRYDGSDEAKKAVKIVNKISVNSGSFEWNEELNTYYYTDGDWSEFKKSTHRLVTPAEFIRLVSEPKWKVGDECMIDEQHNLKTYKIEHITSDNVCMLNCLTIDKGYTIRHLSTLRPVRKSVREEVHEYIKDAYNCFIPDNGIDRIIDIIKSRKDEL